MTKTGTAIERSPEELPDYPAGEAVPVEVVSVTAGGNEVANRVLSLLGSLGNLALRIIEIRASSASGPVDSAAPATRREPAASREPRAARAPRSGGRGRRQRRRQRGAG